MRSIAVASILVLTLACTTLSPVRPADLTSSDPIPRVWVTSADHSVVVFDSARVSADSLVGIVHGEPRSIALSEATVIRAREFSEGRTAALIFFGAGGAVAVATVYLLNNQRPARGPCVFLCAIDHPNCCEG